MTSPAAPETHACAICGAPAAFGFGPPLRRDRIWTCAAHRGRGAPKKGAPLPSPAPKRRPARSAEPDLFGGR